MGGDQSKEHWLRCLDLVDREDAIFREFLAVDDASPAHDVVGAEYLTQGLSGGDGGGHHKLLQVRLWPTATSAIKRAWTRWTRRMHAGGWGEGMHVKAGPRDSAEESRPGRGIPHAGG